ncbi:AAA family ATPase [Jiella sonneratiae]|uniref:AAA family ATPase n=1 Tax=Jiella sonneratiae TaxID=2816856 RepID=A0ABS3J4K0_9HYPH|nr:AAA family ATPase [Jiella sonneratiae]MBO0904609.1 AAA family ATPase [Jiella sonneratiae]
MYLKSLAVSEFASLAEARLEALDPGLNVVVGDNEAGKSTLLKALRAAFFQKHRGRGETVEAFLPYCGEGRPSVSIAFSHGGADYRLSKSFLTRPAAELLGPWPSPVSGDAVEEKLAELFGFVHPGRGDSKLAEHQGAFGLLWVEQGRSNGGLDIGAGRDAVTASLEGEVGTILGGERGRSLIAAAKALNDRHFTATGRTAANAPLKAIDDELTRAREDLVGRRAALAELEEKLKRLEDRRRALKGYEEAATLEKAEEALRSAEAAMRRAEDHDREWQAAESAVRQAEAVRTGAAEALKRRDDLVKAVEAARTAFERAAADHAEIDAAARLAVEAVTAAAQAQEEARKALKAAEDRHESHRRRADLSRAVAERDRLSAVVAEAGDLTERIAALAAHRDLLPIDQKSLAAVEKAERRRRDCEVRLQVAAPAVTFEPEADGAVQREDGQAVAAGVPTRVTSRSRYLLGGFGAVTIEPGGGAANLESELREAEAALAALLKGGGAASGDEARRLFAERQDVEAELKLVSARRDALVSDGLDAAKARLRAAEAAADRLNAAIGGEGSKGAAEAEAEATAGESGDDEALAESLVAALNKARRATATADERLRAASKESEAAALRRAAAESDRSHLEAQALRLRSECEGAEAAAPRTTLVDRLAEADADLEAKRGRLALKERERVGDGREAAEARQKAAERTLRQIGRTLQELRDETIGLEAEVRVSGGSGLGETVQLLEEEIADLERRRARTALEASAARLLYETLGEARRAARERWLGPIKTRVAPYLRLIHPESDIDLDEETLELKGLTRAGVAERFERLSAGAREQVAVVTRLALAQVLKQGGHPAAVILDDALVNTDEIRLERMHQVLREAAKDLQVIVLTCRERDFRDLGAPTFRL